jgi:hypothetical protein
MAGRAARNYCGHSRTPVPVSARQTWSAGKCSHWEGGLKHLTKLKGQLTDVDFGNCISEPADVERLRALMPSTKIVWKGLGAGKEELQKAWIRPKAEKWLPKELLDRVIGERGAVKGFKLNRRGDERWSEQTTCQRISDLNRTKQTLAKSRHLVLLA